jgi:leucyl-tRNA synthetase
MTRHAESKGFGRGSTLYRLKDWGVSRQRYWGTPIPMIHCGACGIVPVPESDLPILLPDDVTFTGKGGSPLETSASFHDVRCPGCGRQARRDTDTMDTFVDSSWYFFRYLDPANDREPFRKDLAEAWFPIDLYVGGITHAILHLMYARFFGMVLRDLGLTGAGEPVERLLCQGMVLKDGGAMSKSRGNVVAPDEMVKLHGADVTRLFVLFAAPPEKDLEWSDSGIEGLERFVKRAWRLVDAHAEVAATPGGRRVPAGGRALNLRRKAHQTLARVTDDIDRRLHLNTAIAAIMELVNAIYLFAPPEAPVEPGEDAGVLIESIEIMAACLSPFAPHLAEEMWARLGHEEILASRPWPKPDGAMLAEESVVIVVQVDGKMRGRLEVPAGSGSDEVIRAMRDDDRLSRLALGGGTEGIERVVFVPDKLINVVLRR